MALRPIRTDDVNKTRQDVGIQVVSSYLTGGKISPQEAGAAQSYINTLSENQIAKLKFYSERAHGTGPRADAAYDRLTEAVVGCNRASPLSGERFVDVFVTSDPKLEIDIGPKELAVQQQQAYLKVLGYDIGKTGLDGIAGKDSKTQKALDDFAKKMGLDPNDKERVNQALSRSMIAAHQKPELERMQKTIDAGKASPDDIKILQWALKANGAQMPLSLRGDKMDGIAGSETKTLLKALIEEMANEPVVKRISLRDKFAPAVTAPSAPDLLADPKIDVPDLTRYTNLPDVRTRLEEDGGMGKKPSRPGYTDVLGGINVTGIDLGGDFSKAGRGNALSLSSPEVSGARFAEDVAMRKDRMQVPVSSGVGSGPSQ